MSLFMVGLNPNGYRKYIFPLGTLSSPVIQALIGEWFSPDFHELAWVPLALLMLGILGMGLFNPKRHALTTVGFVVGSAYAALRTLRNVHLFAILATPVMAGQLEEIAVFKPPQMTRLRRANLLLWPLLVAAVLGSLLWVQFVFQNQSKVERETLPAGAADWIEAHPSNGRIFNTYHWGGYLTWRLYPDYSVFIDGRAELHGDALIRQYVEIYNTRNDWQQLLQSYDVSYVLVEPDYPLAQQLNQTQGWYEVYADRVSVLYMRKQPTYINPAVCYDSECKRSWL